MSDKTRELVQRLQYTFRDAGLLARALTHRSHGNQNYERLEFLGDSILSFLVADLLYDRFPRLPEGDLTRLRATLVRRETLAGLARGLKLGDFLELGSGELKSGGFDRDSILADSLEAIIGAIYKDGGLDAARQTVLRLYASVLRDIDPQAILKDPKTRLQEILQGNRKPLPTYTVVNVKGEAHNQEFTVQCDVVGLDIPLVGVGSSRRKAEQEAAGLAFAQVTDK